MTYLIEVIVYTAVMLFIYVLFLRNKPLYGLCRTYLLASAVLPMVIPFIHLPESAGARLQQTGFPQFELPAAMVGVSGKIEAAQKAIPWLWIAYAAGSLMFITWHLWNVVRLIRIARRSGIERQSGYSVVKSSGYGPGSFGKYVFFPEEEINETILAHEQAHIHMHHTRDILLLNLLQALCWPNVLLLWIRTELRQVHEFQADAAANATTSNYAGLLLGAVFNTPGVPMMHLFNIHPIKRRIMMLKNKGKASPVKATVVVCLSFTIFAGIAVGVQSCSKKTNTSTNNNETAKRKPGEPYAFVQQMPTSGYDLSEFLTKNLKYPKEAREKKIEGKVIVRFTVDENGNITNPECVRSANPLLDSEALRVVATMPKWTPGEENGKKVPVYYVLPIVFRL